MPHWTMKAIHWWNHHCDTVLVWACVFVGGMIVGSCVRFGL